MKITKFLNIDIEPAPPEMELEVEMECREIMKANDLDNIKRYCTHLVRKKFDQDIQLVKFAGAQGAYSERTFGPEFEDAIENADLSVVSNFTDNPTIKINSSNKLLVQFRARVDADKRANGYRIKLRQVLEAGTGLFYL